jgi:hypothetical protein
MSPTDEFYRLICAIIARALRDLKSSDEMRADKARRWLRTDYAAEMAESTGVIHSDCLAAYAAKQ